MWLSKSFSWQVAHGLLRHEMFLDNGGFGAHYNPPLCVKTHFENKPVFFVALTYVLRVRIGTLPVERIGLIAVDY